MTKIDKAKAKAVAAFRTHETGGGKLTPFAGYDVIAQKTKINLTVARTTISV